MSNPAFTEQRHYQFQSDSSNVNDSGTLLGSEDTANTADIALDGVFFLRIKIVNTGDMNATDPLTLQYEKNDTGGFVTVTTTSSNVRVAAGQETDAAAVTELLTNDGGSYSNGDYDDVDGSNDANVPGGNEVEFVWSITCRSAEMSVSDTLDFQVLQNGSVLDEYDVTPECTVVAAAGDVLQAQVWM